jgi:hypothetical protein
MAKNKGQRAKQEELTKEKARKLPLLLLLQYVAMKTQKKWREIEKVGVERKKKETKTPCLNA